MNIVLKELSREFAADMARALNDVRITSNLRDLPAPYTIEDAEQYIEQTVSDGGSYVFAVTVNEKFVGCISATRGVNIHSRAAEVGYYIVPEHWGEGIATRALEMLCGYIFRNTDIIRLYAEPFSRNAASCRVLEKAGFVLEGVMRSAAVKDGVCEDMKLYSLLDS